MSVDRIGTFSLHNKTVSDMLGLQTSLAKIQQQISSGTKASTFADMGSDVSKTLSLKTSINSIEHFIDGNKTVISRLDTMFTAIGQILNVVSGFEQDVLREQGGNAASVDLTRLAEAALDQTEGLLNTQQSGRSLFAGAKTDKVAVANLRTNSNLAGDQVTANYYQGDDLTFSVKASEQLMVNYGIKANDEAFQYAIGAMHKAIVAEASGNKADLETTSRFIGIAKDSLIKLRNQIGADTKALENMNKQHQTVSDQLSGVLSDLTQTDIVSASIEVNSTQAVLTASMQAFVRISNLNLSDFLR